MTIFPKEIIENTSEKHFFRFSTASFIIYTTVILLVISTIAILPIVKVDISVQGTGLIRSEAEQSQLCSPVTSQVEKIAIKENQFVHKGDTLLWLNKRTIEEKLRYLQKKKR